ncbi:MAG TPA: DUF2892 domain-containing protein [Myxococcales bacterium]|nr:hypothetical protein [Myxococcales bacterium]HAN30658.1 DUF2892 domain-containing protein [Myxococcales bacterium]
MFETNQNKAERILRLLVAGLMLPAPLVLEPNAYTLVMAAFGGVMLFNALSGTCYTYKIFGVNTCDLPSDEG